LAGAVVVAVAVPAGFAGFLALAVAVVVAAAAAGASFFLAEAEASFVSFFGPILKGGDLEENNQTIQNNILYIK
jgi:hypothetical protein